jgi:hypothetical protein
MNITVNFLLQATRILHVGNYNDDDLEMVYNFMVNVDNEILIHYLNSKSVLAYESDLELYIELIDVLVSIYENNEEYENCKKLLDKKEEAIIILKK